MRQFVKDCIDDARQELKELNDEFDDIEEMKKELFIMIDTSLDDCLVRNYLVKIMNYYRSRAYTEGYIAGLSIEAEE